ncbi:MAG: protein kinase [Calditrichaceae bacterium]
MSVRVGEKVSHYHILKQIGGGGMGIVYMAEDIKLGRKVALKFLPPELTRDEESKKRFIHEALAVSKLEHTNICSIYEINETDDGQLYICMPYCEGNLLKTLLGTGPLETDMILRITRQLARGLNCAHHAGIIHRDIKPSNIVISPNGMVRILDFGLAKFSGQTKLTKTGIALGTVGYMSPEQARGDPVDHRTDIWSFGVVLYEMLTGELPFRGDYEQAVIYSILHEKPVKIDPSNHKKRILLEKLCDLCLEKNPDLRPQSMMEVLELLEGKSAGLMYGIKRKLTKTVTYFIAASLVALTVFWVASSRISLNSAPVDDRWRVGVLPFRTLTKNIESKGLPMLIQNLIVRELTGVKELGIVDPLSLNGLIRSSEDGTAPIRDEALYRRLREIGIVYVVDGTITQFGNKLLLQSSVVESQTAEIKFSYSRSLIDEDNILQEIDSIVVKILNHLRLKFISSTKATDIAPWIRTGSENIPAIQAFIQAGQYNFRLDPAAEKYLLRAIELDSTFLSPRIWLISKLMQQQDVEQANTHYEILRKLESNATPFEEVMIDWAGAMIANDYPAQARYLRIALEYSPQNNILLFSLARILYMMNDYSGSIQTLKNIVEMEWEYSPAYYLLGASYFQTGDRDKAKNVLESSIQIKPVFPQIYCLLSILSLETEDSAKSQLYEDLYIKSMQERGIRITDIHADLASSYFEVGMFKPSSDHYEKALSLGEPIAEYHNGLGMSLFFAGNPDAAKDEFYKTINIDSGFSDAYYMLGIIYEEANNPELAIQYFKNCLRIDSLSQNALIAGEHLKKLTD